MHVRQTTDQEFDDAFAVLQSVANWLQAKGRRQRISATTLETYAAWQAAGQNYAVLEDQTIVGVFTLCYEVLTDWPNVAPSHTVPFLRALATHPDHQGKGVGVLALKSAGELSGSEPLYLDCVSDFLPTYYSQHGFEPVQRQQRTYSDGDYDITLMVRTSQATSRRIGARQRR